MVVDTRIGRLGLDFIEPLSFRVLQCWRYGEAAGPVVPFRDSIREFTERFASPGPVPVMGDPL
jgi:hypothetical protein